MSTEPVVSKEQRPDYETQPDIFFDFFANCELPEAQAEQASLFIDELPRKDRAARQRQARNDSAGSPDPTRITNAEDSWLNSPIMVKLSWRRLQEDTENLA